MSLEGSGNSLLEGDDDEICRYCGCFIEDRDQRCAALSNGVCRP